MFRIFIIAILASLTLGCAVNPVTGEQQLMFVSEGEDAQIGQTQYKPAQQSQGGVYYLDPELTLYVASVGKKLAAVSDRPDLPYEFVILNNSVPNAWALPSGKIAINRGLLIQLRDEAQLASVLSHEIVHAAARHSAQRQQQNMIVQAGMMGLGLAIDNQDYKDVIIGGAVLGATLTMAQYGQEHELESDYYGMKYMAAAGYDLQGAVELQELFVKLSQSRQSSWLQGLFASHPPSPDRVAANKQTIAEFPSAGSYRGKSVFQKKMKYLISKTPAYEAQDKASTLIGKKQYLDALIEIDKAIKSEPDEASFYATKGDIYSAQGNDKLALAEYDKAVALFPEQFSAYLKKGIINEKLGNLEQAKRDLARSKQLLPTAVAELALGNIAEQQGDSRSAIRHYGKAAEAQGSNGQQARTLMATLEIPNQPNKYIKIKHRIGKQRELVAYIENHSEVGVDNVVIESTLIAPNGNIQSQKRWKANQTVPAKKRGEYLQDPVSQTLPQGYSIKSKVLSASIIK